MTGQTHAQRKRQMDRQTDRFFCFCFYLRFFFFFFGDTFDVLDEQKVEETEKEGRRERCVCQPATVSLLCPVCREVEKKIFPLQSI